MKKLYIIRHAKAEKSVASYVDFDRPLEPSGRKDAEHMAKYCLSKLEAPDIMVSSPAVRTLETLMPFKDSFPGTQVIHVNDLYHASAGTIRKTVKELPDEASVAYIFGHNNGMLDLVNSLTATDTAFPTCAVAVFESDASSWEGFFDGKPALIHFLTPKLLNG